MIIRWWTLAAAGGTLAAATAAFLTGSWAAAVPALAALPAGLLAGLLPKREGEAGNSGIHAVDDVAFLEARLQNVEEDLQRLTDEQDLLRGVFEVSTELVGCVDEGDARSRFAAAMRRWWSCRHIDLMLWERGKWRAMGSDAVGDPPELLQGVQLPDDQQSDLILDLSAGVDGQAAIIVRNAEAQPTIAHLHRDIQMRIAEVLRSQLALSLRRVLLYQHLQELARVDPLTTTHRRWYGERRLEELVEGGEVVAVAMVDIDHFKQVNDSFGHAAGDQVLTAVGTALGNGIRHGDLVCRYGGEEFLLILPNASPASAGLVAERLRAAIAAIADLPTSVTVSIGTACVHQDEAALELVQRADQALYTAKHEGRNRVVSAEADMPSGSLRTTGRSRRSTARNRVL
jgi:diguanylate cyclase (GGDEF)-like protein